MNNQNFLILVINPGSTSTKFGLYENETPLFEETVRHPESDFASCQSIFDQKDVRAAYMFNVLKERNINPASINAVVGRGGLVAPLDSGTYTVNDKMLRDLTRGIAGSHASCLGGILAHELSKEYGIPAFVVDPVVVDEMEPYAKLTGIPGIERRSVFHALNSKAVARQCAESIGSRYEDSRFVIAHMGGGITVSAHRYGRVIDVNDALSGEGAFTPERCGSVPLEPVIEMCFSGQYAKNDILAMCNKRGGVRAYLGTNDMREVETMIKHGDDYAALVMDSMAYQVAKEIGAMIVALEGRVDGIILTGGMAWSMRFTGAIKQRVDQMAKVYTYPGEHEMIALALGGLRILQGKELPAIY